MEKIIAAPQTRNMAAATKNSILAGPATSAPVAEKPTKPARAEIMNKINVHRSMIAASTVPRNPGGEGW